MRMNRKYQHRSLVAESLTACRNPLPAAPQAAPTTGPVVCDNCLEEVKQSTPPDRFAFVHLNCSCRGIALPLVDDAFRVGSDRVIDEDVDMVFGSQERANVTVECEIR